MRIPNSWRRCSTEYPTTPNMPSDASSSEDRAKDIARNIGKRRSSTDCEMTSVIGRKETTGTSASMSWIALRTGGAELPGSVDVRRMNETEVGTEIALNHAGTYTIISGGLSSFTVRM